MIKRKRNQKLPPASTMKVKNDHIVVSWFCKMTSLVNKSADWPPNYHKFLIFFPTTSWKRPHATRIDELTDSNEPATRELACDVTLQSNICIDFSVWSVLRQHACPFRERHRGGRRRVQGRDEHPQLRTLQHGILRGWHAQESYRYDSSSA